MYNQQCDTSHGTVRLLWSIGLRQQRPASRSTLHLECAVCSFTAQMRSTAKTQAAATHDACDVLHSN
jgi:hypothetical protein